MEAGKVYEFFVDCTRNDLVTFGDIADAIVEQMNEVLGITTRKISFNSVQPGIVLPDYNFDIPSSSSQYVFAFRIPNPADDAKADDSRGVMKINLNRNGASTNIGGTVGNTNYFEGYTKYSHGDYGYYATGQIIFRFDTTQWTPNNKTYQISVVHTDRHQGMQEIPSDFKFTRPFFVTEVTKKQDGSKHMGVIRAGTTDIACALDTEQTIAVAAGTATINKNAITLHRAITGEYENEFFYWVHNGENLTVGNYAIFDNLPYLEKDGRIVKGYDSTFVLFLTDATGSTNSPSLLIKQ